MRGIASRRREVSLGKGKQIALTMMIVAVTILAVQNITVSEDGLGAASLLNGR